MTSIPSQHLSHYVGVLNCRFYEVNRAIPVNLACPLRQRAFRVRCVNQPGRGIVVELLVEAGSHRVGMILRAHVLQEGSTQPPTSFVLAAV